MIGRLNNETLKKSLEVSGDLIKEHKPRKYLVRTMGELGKLINSISSFMECKDNDYQGLIDNLARVQLLLNGCNFLYPFTNDDIERLFKENLEKLEKEFDK